MIEIEEMNDKDVRATIARLGYGHLACCRNDHPYVVPIHFAFDGEFAFVYTTEGKKSEIIRVNPEVCLQAEEVVNNENWTSVMIIGDAEQLSEEADRRHALDLIVKVNPKLTPAVSIRWMDSWVRENVEVVYRIKPRMMTGRRTVKREKERNVLVGKRRRSQLY